MRFNGLLKRIPPSLFLGVGLTYTREPKPYQVTTRWPYPNLRWGFSTFSPISRDIYGGGMQQSTPGFAVGFDTVTPLRKKKKSTT